ncbi:hypothetical protein UF29_22700, partial [Vibrio parahaemolyticus]
TRTRAGEKRSEEVQGRILATESAAFAADGFWVVWNQEGPEQGINREKIHPPQRAVVLGVAGANSKSVNTKP